jgi:hypothetical protein
MYKHRDGQRGRDQGDARPGRAGAGPGVPGKATLVGAIPTMALPPALRARLERALATDLSAVRVGEDPAVAAIGARAHADGTHVMFAPGEYQPESEQGQELIAHEVVHLVQQAEGRVAANAMIGDREVNADGGLEKEADELGARAPRGEPVRTAGPALRAPGGPIQGWFGEKIANIFEPAPHSAGDALAQAARKAGKNLFESANDTERDARTGLLPGEEEVVDDLVTRAEKCIRSWETQRGAKGTPDLRFKRAGELGEIYQDLPRKFPGPSFVDAYREMARRLQLGPNKQYVREIRMFAPDLIKDWADMLGVRDEDIAEPGHHYEFMPVFAIGGSRGLGGPKAGITTRTIKVRYTCDAIPGLKWEQKVQLTGFVFGFGGGTGGAASGNSLSVDFPGGWKEADKAPRRYLAPDFFEGAAYTRPSAGASGSIGPAKVGGAGIGHLLISNGADKLDWNLDQGLEIEAGAGISKDSIENPTQPSAELEAVVEGGTAKLVGDATYHPGKWDKVHYETEPVNEEWTVLHAARVHFATGKSELGREDLATLKQVVDAIRDRDKMKGYEGQIFRIEVVGCHSRKWDSLDDELRAFDGRELTPDEREKRDELQLIKDAENESLAYMRAFNTTDELRPRVADLENRLHLGVLDKSRMDDPTIETPTDKDPYGNRWQERSATIMVSYQLHTPKGRVESDIPIDQSEDNRRAADTMAGDD